MSEAPSASHSQELNEKLFTLFNTPDNGDGTFTSTYIEPSFDPEVEWLDHAFQIRRVGHSAIHGLHVAWRHCNQPFEATPKAMYPTATGFVTEMLWKGKTANDIVRPDGQVAVKATGRDYECHVCMIIKVSAEGKIRRIDEYYHRYWDEGHVETSYTVIKGASLKSA